MIELVSGNPTSIPYPGSVPGPGEEGREARGKLYPRNPGQSEDDVWKRHERRQKKQIKKKRRKLWPFGKKNK